MNHTADPTQTFRISIVSPVYNEEQMLPEFYEHVKNLLDQQTSSWEMVLVNDGSSDGSIDVLKQICQKDQRVKVLHLSRNFGQQVAITAGLDYATGDVVVIMDADLQDPPELIPKMISLWKEGNDVVYGVRTRRQGETILKKATASVFYRLMGRISRINLPVDVGDFRLLSRRAVDSLREIRESNRFLRGLISWIGYNQVGVSYVRDARKSGKTKYSWTRMIRFALDGITSFSYIPLRFATYLGFLVSIAAFLYAIQIIYVKLTRGFDVHGFAAIMVTMLFLGGVQLIGIGLIGEYIGRIYDEVKRRPLYIVQEAINLPGRKEPAV